VFSAVIFPSRRKEVSVSFLTSSSFRQALTSTAPAALLNHRLDPANSSGILHERYRRASSIEWHMHCTH
jgi:hypothetical protein